VADEPSGVHRPAVAPAPPEIASPAEAVQPEAAGEAPPAKEASSIQKFLRRFGIK
jgi:hypothetical protein